MHRPTAFIPTGVCGGIKLFGSGVELSTSRSFVLEYFCSNMGFIRVGGILSGVTTKKLSANNRGGTERCSGYSEGVVLHRFGGYNFRCC